MKNVDRNALRSEIQNMYPTYEKLVEAYIDATLLSAQMLEHIHDYGNLAQRMARQIELQSELLDKWQHLEEQRKVIEGFKDGQRPV